MQMLLPTSRAALSSFLLPPSAAASSSKLTPLFRTSLFLPHPRRPFSSASPYPLYYELVHHRPARPPRHRPQPQPDPPPESAADDPETMDRSKRKYYRKRLKRMYGGSDSDSDSGRRSPADDFVELKPEVVDFPRLHAREQELYFYDAFAFPWEKEKHYRMVYQLEKKYFPDQCLDKAFVDPEAEPPVAAEKKKGKRSSRKKDGAGEERDERGLVFFEEEEKKDRADVPSASGLNAGKRDVSEKKVEEFFKCLKKGPSAGGRKVASGQEEEGGEPYLVSRRTELPPRWDGPSGTVVLVDKPKG